MNLFINPPAYYTQEYGVINDIYQFCMIISHNIDVKEYTDCIDTIGITPIIAPKQILSTGKWKEEKRISLPYRMASISIVSDYDSFCLSDIQTKKQIILENILKSLRIVQSKLKNKFDYQRIESDIINLFSSIL